MPGDKAFTSKKMNGKGITEDELERANKTLFNFKNAVIYFIV